MTAARVAEQVLSGRGLDFAAAARADGWTNETWFCGDLVVRVARQPGQADLVREAALAALFPPEVGYPEVVDAGVLDGHEWVLSRRIPARNLEDVWPELDDRQRASAVEQVWARAEHVHRLDIAAVAPHARARSPFFSESAGEVKAALVRLGAAGLLTERQQRELGAVMDRFWAALPGAPRVLNHGDLGMCNVLWDDGRVVSIFDFEFGVVAPVEVDLNELLKFCTGESRARRAALDIARSALSGGVDVLLGYSVMLELWLCERDPSEPEPHRLLTALAEGRGGHLGALLEG
ncbi:aminoglycoside phosphotransferase family protein [Saccharopolyspora taberi]|uniref:Aminoglycoside phosphotransferase domain-containing protein n=1 Tax=Saccharopolyspora taberi TaxID=60895 RepID=A0ABN3V575_9PSEU